MRRKHRDVGAAAHQAYVAALREGRKTRATTIGHKRVHDTVGLFDGWDNILPKQWRLPDGSHEGHQDDADGIQGC